MTRRIAVILIAFLLFAYPAYAGRVTFGDFQLANSYITRNNCVYVALNDIAGQLGLSVIYDGERLLIGDTVMGTLSIDPDSHLFFAGDRAIDFGNPIVRDGGNWYVPDTFLDFALGVETRLDAEGGELVLLPAVVEITPLDRSLKITASKPLEFSTFELTVPSRRVIDISGACLVVPIVEVNGNALGMTGIASLRASQYSVDPPVVRVVIEWAGAVPPHTLFPEDRSISILISTSSTGDSSVLGKNLIQREYPSPETPPEAPIIIPPTQPVVPPRIPDAPEHQETQGNPDIPPQPDNEDERSDGDWGLSFTTDEDGEVIAELITPPFTAINYFTLAGGGMRLVIDLAGAHIEGEERRLAGLGDIACVRVAQFQPDIARVVFDFNRVMGYQIEDDGIRGRVTVRILSGDVNGKTIVIDPGHGGEDPGAVHHGIQEKDLNLEMAFFLQEMLEAQGARVILTRQTDVYITLARRIEIAEQNNADMFICIHNNATDQLTAMQGSLILYNNESYMPLYRLVHRGIAARTGVPGIGPVYDERGLFILRHAGDMPVVFVEGAFMTNMIDFVRLTDSQRTYARNIMAGVLDGIGAWFAGRDLPPVVYPDYGTRIETGIFNLGGQSIVISDDGVPAEASDSGSAWDTSDEETGSNDDDTAGAPTEEDSADSDESSDSASSDESDDSGTSDDDVDDSNRAHENRGRGSYRF